MPKISAPSLVQQRKWRRSELLDAAASLALESGATAITVSAVAARAGLSRTSFYEYFASTSDIVAELITEELKSFSHFLEEKVANASDPDSAITSWIEGSLEYVADGRHLLAKALSALEISGERSQAIALAHKKMLAPLATPLRAMGIADIAQALMLIHATTDSASRRIESGVAGENEIAATCGFILAGLKALQR